VSRRKNKGHVGRYPVPLIVLAVVSACIYVSIAALSPYFDFEASTTERPIPLVITLFAAAFIIYLWAIRHATRATQDRRLLLVICAAAVTFRLVLLPSQPIQEVDIYRYLWDGAASNEGVSPFRYSPQQVQTVSPVGSLDEDLNRLVELRDRDPEMATILKRVHFSELPTVYPPFSQAVFAAAAFTTPEGSSVWLRVVIMKAWLVGFDLATLILVMKLLQLAGKPVGLSLTYGWCPLLMKEVANSGHLDAIAVFMTTLTVYLTVKLVVYRKQSARRVSLVQAAVGALTISVILGLAVGAKLYPIVLAPLVLFLITKQLGWKIASGAGVAFATTTLLVLWPMLPAEKHHERATNQHVEVANEVLPTPAAKSPANDPSLGIQTFLRYWEMNDFIFLLTVENLKPTNELPNGQIAWFSLIPERFRVLLVSNVSNSLRMNAPEVPFFVARAITALAFVILSGCFAWQLRHSSSVDCCVRCAFLTLAWFWLLCPTQNPWYWTWALPLLPFARSRAWLALSGLVMLYYLRFSLSYHWPDTSVLGTGYVGHVFFDFVVTWIEFAPWFVWLTLEYWWFRKASGTKTELTAEKGKSTQHVNQQSSPADRFAQTV